ncbi:hypothetical protein RBG61_11360 [Paludicola sp. MB14-C6]|uniref:hypothetical protein n=1 Tax=Paludihabitans sp. MB14-C6 TaxID=3070656 RepID=UPI0027DB3611|nr:hypothetical protein [Paludicola sp. MB14-C6]WMJ22580.1 hypothetical protein RBG61_11360 [Paludicola sp. MB14-C6]
MNKLQFQDACEKVIDVQRNSKGIGTLGEKTLHAVLKHYFEPYEDNHEIKVGGYVADIVGENGIIEIQTRNFEKLRKKLAAFLEVTTVTVVYPIAQTKWLYWINQETGETTVKRKSPKIGLPFEIVWELYKIKDLLNHPNISFCIAMIDVDEYRNLDGWSKDKKKGSSRFDRIPIDIMQEIYLRCPADYDILLPPNLPTQFTTKDLKNLMKVSPRAIQSGMSVLRKVGLIEQVGKQGRLNLYQIIDVS